ncbi:outer membrane beta-barrel protein [Flavobacterium sp. DG1-102-2]|uniref:outer membrane beta-barrel protein n=1 Tax=Flavobacterium sp. DG1-102-2 TaxID=3081663 RepID=UPI00294A5576|nr:outer membrane beta-barrel protein [Flavobacterium sp. DG1-102-2]MDV6167403.1 outer membrane beta-barrel protein [Flavobacterium sp. DG1-102-2]
MKAISTVVLLFITVMAVQAQDTITKKVPFDGMDLTWINGQNRQKNFPLTLKDKDGETILTGVTYLDAYYNYNFANPTDNTQTISSTIGRHNEFTLNLASIGLETNYKNIIGRVWLQYGQMGSIVNDLDGSVNRGRNTSIYNLKYIREAAAGYHFNTWYGINVEMGIFMSYIGLESYVTQENWSYQRSMLCDFTPFYFTGARVQVHPSKNLRTELWLLNGWQSYNSFSKGPGLGSSTYYRPSENLQLVANFYLGRDTQNPDTEGNQSERVRFHHDNSIVGRYYKNPESKGISQAAFSLNSHYGFQSNDQEGDIVKAKDNFMIGTSLANRVWFNKNKMAVTLRADYMTNQSVVNGVNVSPYLAFTPATTGDVPNNYDSAIANGDKLKIFQFTTTFDIMPSDFVTFRLEYGYRNASVPYFTGSGGTTSASGWTNGPTGTTPWAADLKKSENRITLAVNFRL